MATLETTCVLGAAYLHLVFREGSQFETIFGVNEVSQSDEVVRWVLQHIITHVPESGNCQTSTVMSTTVESPL